MMAIGMGKLKGAEFYHKAAIQYTFPRIITDAARLVVSPQDNSHASPCHAPITAEHPFSRGV